MAFTWTQNIAVGAAIDAADITEIRNNVNIVDNKKCKTYNSSVDSSYDSSANSSEDSTINSANLGSIYGVEDSFVNSANYGSANAGEDSSVNNFY